MKLNVLAWIAKVLCGSFVEAYSPDLYKTLENPESSQNKYVHWILPYFQNNAVIWDNNCNLISNQILNATITYQR